MQNISTLLNGYYTNRKYGQRNIKIQPKPQSLPTTYSMLPTDFVTKHCTIILKIGEEVSLCFRFKDSKQTSLVLKK